MQPPSFWLNLLVPESSDVGSSLKSERRTISINTQVNAYPLSTRYNPSSEGVPGDMTDAIPLLKAPMQSQANGESHQQTNGGEELGLSKSIWANKYRGVIHSLMLL